MAKALKSLLLNMVTGSRTEEACLQYDLHQSKEDENTFIFHETWSNAAGLEQHRNMPHVLAFQEQAQEMIDGDINIFITEKIA